MSAKTSSSVKQLPRNDIETGELETPLYELKCATDVVDAVHTAMEEGACPAETFTDALFGAVMYLGTVYRQFESIIYTEGPSK